MKKTQNCVRFLISVFVVRTNADASSLTCSVLVFGKTVVLEKVTAM